VLAAHASQYRSAGGAGEMLHGDRRYRAAKQTLAHGAGIERGEPAVKAVAGIDRPCRAGQGALARRTSSNRKARRKPASIIRRDSILRPRSMPAGKRSEATNHLLEIVKRDRKWNETAARKQLVQFFRGMGADRRGTVEGRKRLSTILFS